MKGNAQRDSLSSKKEYNLKSLHMQKVPDEVYSLINNDIYKEQGERWWQPDFPLNLLRALYNPFRVGYAKRIIDQLHISPEKISVLEVGCGGGILSEEIAKTGFTTTGIDPAEESLEIARAHAKESQLNIIYAKGAGEKIPYPDRSFDVVLCCDVLEHVQDLPKVIAEASRVLKDGGLFIYDTFNRTFMSKISIIKVLQDWNRWAIMPPNIHVWKMFIKPREIRSLLMQNQLEWKEHRGIEPGISYFRMLRYLRKRAAGELTYQEFGEKFLMEESKSTRIMYMGYAVKNVQAGFPKHS